MDLSSRELIEQQFAKENKLIMLANDQVVRHNRESATPTTSSGSERDECDETVESFDESKSEISTLTNQQQAQPETSDYLLEQSLVGAFEMSTSSANHLKGVMQQQHQQAAKHQQDLNQASKEFEEVKQVELFGVRIVALAINGKERLCLAQISNTLLKDFSYNEIHNRRVALGITCVQCTPIQLEMLRRAGAMPSSSRRCGMITMREAERLCRSFLVEEQPPELPENFYFTVAHRVNYGCKGRFIPAKYISSRAKCIECFYCGDFYSPNKFIFHSHRQPHATDCNPPDSPNINSWRKHIDLDWSHEHSQEIKYAWEDVKSLFNGGTRRRAPNNSSSGGSSNSNKHHHHHHHTVKVADIADDGIRNLADYEDQLIDVESDESGPQTKNLEGELEVIRSASRRQVATATSPTESKNWQQTGSNRGARSSRQVASQSLMVNSTSATVNKQNCIAQEANNSHLKRPNVTQTPALQQPSKRFSSCNLSTGNQMQTVDQIGCQLSKPENECNQIQATDGTATSSASKISAQQLLMLNSLRTNSMQQQLATNGQSLHYNDFITRQRQSTPISGNNSNTGTNKSLGLIYPASNASNFIYSQLYNQLVQPQQQQPQQVLHDAANNQGASSDAHLALRHHLWASLLANLQCNSATTSPPTYNLPALNQLTNQTGQLSGASGEQNCSPTNLSHMIPAHLYSQGNSLTGKLYQQAGNESTYSAHKFSASNSETREL